MGSKKMSSTVIKSQFPGYWSFQNMKLNKISLIPVRLPMHADFGLNLNLALDKARVELVRVTRFEHMKNYLLYCTEREAFKKSKGLSDNEVEELLWYPLHDSENPKHIIEEGFNFASIRTFSARQGRSVVAKQFRYGNGLHLFREYLSLVNTENEFQTVKFFLCRALVGNVCVVSNSCTLAAPPENFDNTGSEDGKVVVVFKHTQVYPEFVVEFKIRNATVEEKDQQKKIMKKQGKAAVDTLKTLRASNIEWMSSMSSGLTSEITAVLQSTEAGSRKRKLSDDEEDSSSNADDIDDAKWQSLAPVKGSRALYYQGSRSSGRAQPVQRQYKNNQRIYYLPDLSRFLSDCVLNHPTVQKPFIVPLPDELTSLFTPSNSMLGRLCPINKSFKGANASAKYSKGSSTDFTFLIKVNDNVMLEITDKKFKLQMDGRRENSFKAGADTTYENGYRRDFPPYLTPDDIDAIMIEFYKAKDRIQLPEFAKKILGLDPKTEFQIEKLPASIDENTYGDYNFFKDLKSFYIPIGTKIALAVPDPKYQTRTRHWPPKLDSLEYKLLQSISEQKSFHQHFTCPPIADVIEGYKSNATLTRVLLKNTSLQPYDSFKKGDYDSKFLDGTSFVIPINSDEGIRFLAPINKKPRIAKRKDPFDYDQSEDDAAMGGAAAAAAVGGMSGGGSAAVDDMLGGGGWAGPERRQYNEHWTEVHKWPWNRDTPWNTFYDPLISPGDKAGGTSSAVREEDYWEHRARNPWGEQYHPHTAGDDVQFVGTSRSSPAGAADTVIDLTRSPTPPDRLP